MHLESVNDKRRTIKSILLDHIFQIRHEFVTISKEDPVGSHNDIHHVLKYIEDVVYSPTIHNIRSSIWLLTTAKKAIKIQLCLTESSNMMKFLHMVYNSYLIMSLELNQILRNIMLNERKISVEEPIPTPTIRLKPHNQTTSCLI